MSTKCIIIQTRDYRPTNHHKKVLRVAVVQSTLQKHSQAHSEANFYGEKTFPIRVVHTVQRERATQLQFVFKMCVSVTEKHKTI